MRVHVNSPHPKKIMTNDQCKKRESPPQRGGPKSHSRTAPTLRANYRVRKRGNIRIVTEVFPERLPAPERYRALVAVRALILQHRTFTKFRAASPAPPGNT